MSCQFPVTPQSDPKCILQAFQQSGYFYLLNEQQQESAMIDPRGWLNAHPYLCMSFSKYFAGCPGTEVTPSTPPDYLLQQANNQVNQGNAASNNPLQQFWNYLTQYGSMGPLGFGFEWANILGSLFGQQQQGGGGGSQPPQTQVYTQNPPPGSGAYSNQGGTGLGLEWFKAVTSAMNTGAYTFLDVYKGHIETPVQAFEEFAGTIQQYPVGSLIALAVVGLLILLFIFK